MSPRKGRKGPGRRATPSALRPGAESDVMTLRQVAQYLNCSYVTAHKLVQRGGIPGFRFGGSSSWRVLKSEVDKWIAKGGGSRNRPYSRSPEQCRTPPQEVAYLSNLIKTRLVYGGLIS